MANKKICGVYQIKNLKNDLIYIGSSKNIKKRWSEHKWRLNKGNHDNRFLQMDWNNYGEDCFEFSILKECGENTRYELEQKYFDELLPFYRGGNGNGYNINESALCKNEGMLRIYRDKCVMINPFRGLSEEDMKSLYLSYYQHEFPMEEYSINNEDYYLWYDLKGDICGVKLQDCKMRFLFRQEVDSMTRQELINYCEGLETFEDMENYMFEEVYGCYIEPEVWL